MTQRNPLRHFVLVALLAIAATFPAGAEDVEKKFRIGVATGFLNPQDSVLSDAGNSLVLVDDALIFEEAFIDPRNDSAIFGALDVQPAFSGTFFAQYAISKVILVEASIGYSKHDFGETEVQVQFSGVDVPEFMPFDFNIYRIPVGKIERIPVQLSALARFRPRASFNPYVGFGVGYAFHGFEVDSAFNEFSMALDGSFGAMARLTAATFGNPRLTLPPTTAIDDLDGAVVKVQDTFEWHLAGGIEYSLKRKWALIIDARWTFSSRAASVGFNGGTDLGVAVPQRTDFLGSDAANAVYGGVYIPDGGLFDGGMLVPLSIAPPNTDCALTPLMCVFDRTLPDGIVDPGIYYAQGGEVEYGGVSLSAGVRYTF